MQHICREFANKKRKFTKDRCFVQLNIKNTHTKKTDKTKQLEMHGFLYYRNMCNYYL